MKILRDLLTQGDNETFCPVRLCGLIGFIIYNVMTVIHSLHHCNDFDPVQYSIGLSTIIGIISASVSLRAKTEN